MKIQGKTPAAFSAWGKQLASRPMTIEASVLNAMLTLAVTTKLLTEIALLSLVGHGVVGLMSRQGSARNPVYRLFQRIGRPWVRAARWVFPCVVIDRHVPPVAVVLLLLLWATTTIAKVSICMHMGVALCK